MSHHGDDSRTIRESLNRQRSLTDGLGATGRYPQGRLCQDDEGEIRVAVAADLAARKVVIDFGKPVAWIGFTPDQAREVGELLIQKGKECGGGRD